LVVEAAIDASHWELRAWTGSAEMSVFQMLSAGKTWQVVDGTGAAPATTGVNSGASAKGASQATRRTVLRIPINE
jgi:hypothetical protein